MKNLKEKVIDLFEEIKRLEDSPNENKKILPENTYYINNGVLCYPRGNGDSRFPYGFDGFYLWAYQSGYLSANESTFYVILPSSEGKEPYVDFFLGIKKGNHYFPVSLLGVGHQPIEENVKRYCVFSYEAVYYLTQVDDIYACVRIYVNEKKEIVVSVIAYNAANEPVDAYLSSYYNMLFKYESGESIETKWFKKVEYKKDQFVFTCPEDIDRNTHINNYGLITRKIDGSILSVDNTTSHMDYVGNKSNPLNCSIPLQTGSFKESREITTFTDTSVAADMIKVNLADVIRVDYVISHTHDLDTLNHMKQNPISSDDLDAWASNRFEYYQNRQKDKNMFSIEVKDWKDNRIKPETFNEFVKSVIYQVEYCALAKNSGTIFLGVRDVLQQIEALLMWNPEASKEKLLEVLGVIDPSGNPPRQYSLPPEGVDVARMDLRPFIDQSVWIISTIYTYLAYTSDYDFLNKTCGYFEINGPGSARRSELIETVFEHMLRVMNYLISNIDPDTHCLKTLYGDWNDALDGLGAGETDEKYGNGVSVMASLQLYQNLAEMIDILKHINYDSGLIEKYKRIRKDLENGLLKYAIHTQGEERRIIHGWGNNRSYYVGSYCDVDQQSRNSLTCNSFWVISKMYDLDPSIKKDILLAYRNLDSKYGLKTFEPYFAPEVKGVGRIVNLVKGAAENAATYCHATLFAIESLMKMGECEFAIEQLEKILPLTHKNITTSPFIMSNSYVYNEEYHMDGESMNDWYTGSATVFIKTIVKGFFGIEPNLDDIRIYPAKQLPFNHAAFNVMVNGVRIHIDYKNNHSDKRVMLINDKTIDPQYQQLKDTYGISLSKEELKNTSELFIKIID